MVCMACQGLLGRRAQVLPLLAPFLGRGRVGNFLVRNKWRSYESIQRCKHLPILLLSSLQARAARSSIFAVGAQPRGMSWWRTLNS